MQDQQENLILMTIRQPGQPTIKMVTEAGIIGKIGLNSKGVGVCLNAIRAKGVDASHLPVHLGLRTVLESASAGEAVQRLETAGMAASAHFLIADASQAVGLEFTHNTFARLAVDAHGRVYHSNHLLGQHPDAHSPRFWLDSEFRCDRIIGLSAALDAKGVAEPSWEDFSGLFEDHGNYPAAICRHPDGISTLFRIVMDLRARQAVVDVGFPCQADKAMRIELQFRDE
jgi:isopenicillin-N N-acyltransferase-like protein